MPLTADQIRQTFIDFFVKKHAHTFVPSSPAVPLDDPTLLFTNAGMNQFKPIFLGQADPNSDMGRLKRAVNSQKCIRAGGKHNDLEDVGKDTYHHTFFEMLGNWSFGDYFKKEAIDWSWELLTKVYGLPPAALYATYFGGNDAAGIGPDLETKALWERYLPPERVLPGNMKDNFWMMGDTGPCGPCTEIHVDRLTAMGEEVRMVAHKVNESDPDVIEIWNNVFIQFNAEYPDDGLAMLHKWDTLPEAERAKLPFKSRAEVEAKFRKLVPLPAKHVDTGMGLERLVSILQHKRSNYDTDIFFPIFEAIERLTGARPYAGKLGAHDKDNVDTAYRVIADHIRTLTFAITDGAVPSNVGRGYVLRRILRRAVRYGRQMLGAKTGFFAELVPVVVDRFAGAFPELHNDPARVKKIILDEEESFGRTLDRGIRLFESVAVDVCAAKLRAALAATPHKQLLSMFNENPAQWTRGALGLDMEESFRHTLGLDAHDALRRGLGVQPHDVCKGAIIPGTDVFKLHDTYGFPPDLTALMAEERGLRVDMAGYDIERKKAEETSRAGGAHAESHDSKLSLSGEQVAQLRHLKVQPTDDAPKYAPKELRARVEAIWNGKSFEEHVKTSLAQLKHPIGIVLDRTCVYANSGGQEADTGSIKVLAEAKSGGDRSDNGQFVIERAEAFGGYVLHIGYVAKGEIRVGDTVAVQIDDTRRALVAANHTATHLANLGLRATLGADVHQKGSLVAQDRLRFDFSHSQPVSPDELAKVEKIVRDQIRQDLTVYAQLAPLAAAKGVHGVRAVFGETYPDPVRVVSIGQPVPDLLSSPANPAWQEVSVEFCGGTHVESTRSIGDFAIISEEAVAKGVRRITAVTGAAAKASILAAGSMDQRVKAAAALPTSDLPKEVTALLAELDASTIPSARKAQIRASITQLQEKIKAAAKEAGKAKIDSATREARILAESASTAMEQVILGTVDAGDNKDALSAALKIIREKCPTAAVMLLSIDTPADAPPKVAIAAAVPDALIRKGLKAGDWVRDTATILGGRGGGKPDAAQGGGTDPSKVKEAIAAARAAAMRILL